MCCNKIASNLTSRSWRTHCSKCCEAGRLCQIKVVRCLTISLPVKRIILQNMSKALKFIWNSIKQYCSPLSSLPRTYEFKQNMDAKSLKIEIFRLICDILKQIVNYLRSTIGLFVKVSYKTHNVNFYLPYSPNAFLPDYGMVSMYDPQLFTDPVVKVFEDLLIVGVVTETNLLCWMNHVKIYTKTIWNLFLKKVINWLTRNWH